MEKTQGISMNGMPVANATDLSVGTAVAMNVAPVLYDDDGSKEKQGGKCCIFCCDYRRAVIIVNGLLVISSVAEMLSALLMKAEDNNLQFNNVDDDAVLKELDTISTPLAIIAGLGIIFHPVALFGAVQYNVPLVGFGILWSVAAMAAEAAVQYSTWNTADDLTKAGESLGSPLPGLIGSIIGTLFFVYAHVMLIREIKTGIMSRETYEREKYSCCCVV